MKPLQNDDLLDAYEILVFVLDELYVKRSAHVSALHGRSGDSARRQKNHAASLLSTNPNAPSAVE